jgi:hypothetical protein
LQKRPEILRTALLLLVVVLLMPACLGRSRAGVGVKSLAADLVFGIPPLPEEVPPPNVDLVPEDAPQVQNVGRGKPSVGSRGLGPSVGSDACPAAGPTDFPDEEATTEVVGQPKQGTYRWIVDGTQEVPAVGTQQLPRQVDRNIFAIRSLGGKDFEYKTKEHELIFGSSVTTTMTWQVLTPQTGRTDVGLFLVGWTRKSRQEERVFAPFTPVLFLPTPAIIGKAVSSPPATSDEGEVLRHSGTITKRLRVDACGKVIDSWFVDGDQTFTSASRQSYTRNFDYAISTQFGGIMVFEHAEVPQAAPQLKYDARIGQVEPKELSEI